MSNISIAQPLRLPCGAAIPNRLAKGAMSEGLASPEGLPAPALWRLYRTWSHGGAGLLMTGNVMIDRDHLERPGNVIIDRPPSVSAMTALRAWTAAGTEGGNHLWMQIGHAGRQTQKDVNPNPKAPSAVRLRLPGSRFGMPTALTGEEVLTLVTRFAVAATAAKEAGFTGVQIHAAHGYLISQFLSPRANLRGDRWGGDLAGRARFLLDVVRKVRRAVGPAYPVGVKLNSADFQRGGFAFEDSLQVAHWLQAEGVDLLEVSGGTYEQPAMMNSAGTRAVDGSKAADATVAREGYFVDFAKAIKGELTTLPLMVTGGFRSRAAMEHALSSGAADLIGIGRPLCVAPQACKDLLAGAAEIPRIEREVSLLPACLGWLKRNPAVRSMSSYAVQLWFDAQLGNMGRHGEPQPSQTVLSAFVHEERERRRWLMARRRLPQPS